MTGTTRTPPRFVPTLTTVLELPPEPAAELPAGLAPDQPASTPAPVDPAEAVALSPSAQRTEADIVRLEEQLLHRVLQRVDFSLEERLSDTVAAAVQQQLDAMVPRLRGGIEAVLRALVIEAMAAELSENPGSTPAFGG